MIVGVHARNVCGKLLAAAAAAGGGWLLMTAA